MTILSSTILAQSPVNYRILDINNIRLHLNNIGGLNYSPSSEGGGYWLQLHQDSIIVFDQGPWVIGKINRRISGSYVEWFIRTSSSFSPGPIINGVPAMQSQPQDSTLYRIYKISRGDGIGNPDYRDWSKSFGAPVNIDGTPKIYGDQMLWTVYNALDANTKSRIAWNRSGDSLKVMPVEIHQLVYARKGTLPDNQDLFSNTVFEEFTIINKGDTDIDSLYFSLWADVDINTSFFPLYNEPASDTTLDLGYCWDKTGSTSYHPAVGYALLYGPSIQSTGNTAIIKGKIKNNYKNLSMTAFHGIIDDADPVPPGNPAFTTTQAWNIARGYFTDGTLKIDPTNGRPTRFTWDGDPVSNTGWILNQNTGGGAGFNMFAGPFTMTRGDTQWVMMALVPALGADYKESITMMRRKVALLRSTPYDSLAFGKMPLIVGVKENKLQFIPTSYNLYQNFPNPFNPTTTINYQLPIEGFVTIKVYDVIGRKVATLVNEKKSVGYYKINFDSSKLTSGVYIYTITANNFIQSKKMLLMK